MNFNRKRGDRAYMEITRTINANKRYYIDENLIINPESLVNTEYKFNDMKIQMYNLLYDKNTKALEHSQRKLIPSGARIHLGQTITITVRYIHAHPV